MQTYRLKHPVTFKSGAPAVEEVRIRPIKGKDLRLIDQFQHQPIAMTLAMIDRLCVMPDGDPVFDGFADELLEEDFDALGKLVMPSETDGPPTG